MGEPRLLEVGRITKAHGIRGEVLVVLSTNRTERVAPGSVLHAGARRLEVVQSTPHQGKWIVAFAGVHSRNDAEALHGALLSAEPLDDPDELWVHELIGSEVASIDGTVHGRIVSVIENPASDLLELDTGGLIPVRFVAGTEPGRVLVELPEGLLDPS